MGVTHAALPHDPFKREVAVGCLVNERRRSPPIPG